MVTKTRMKLALALMRSFIFVIAEKLQLKAKRFELVIFDKNDQVIFETKGEKDGASKTTT